MTTAVLDPNSNLDRRCKLLLSEKDLNFLRMSTNEQRVYIDEQKKELVRELTDKLAVLPGIKKEDVCDLIVRRLKEYKIRGIESIAYRALGPEYKKNQRL